MEGRSTSRKIVMSKGGRVVAVAEQQNGLPVLKCFVEGSKTTAAALAVQRSKAEVWHERLGLLSYGTMARMTQDEAVEGMDVSIKELKCRMSEVCEVCIKAKQAAVSHVESDSRAVQPLQLVHSDLMGPFKPASAGGNLYLMTPLDDYSGYAAVKPLKHKSEATAELKLIITAWERQTEKQVKAVRTDGGKEYTAFDHWCSEKGISRERTVPHTPQQNGRAERLNKTLTEKVRVMLTESKMPKKYWAEAFATAFRLFNVSPRKKERQTPYEKFYKKKPNLQDLRAFGSKTYSQVLPTAKTKLGERSEEGRLLGTEPSTKGWRILFKTSKVVIRCNVTFVEHSFRMRYAGMRHAACVCGHFAA
jgi:transposase InsO family protein